MTNTPTSEQIRFVAAQFTKVLPIARIQGLNMAVPAIHFCGSPNCHWGWYAIARCKKFKTGLYSDGAVQQANDLGFDTHMQMILWFHRNKDIWGNELISHIGSNEIAFYHPTLRPKGAVTLEDIAAHWSECADRMELREAVEVTNEILNSKRYETEISSTSKS